MWKILFTARQNVSNFVVEETITTTITAVAKFEIEDGVAIIPEGTTEIGILAFKDCTSLKSVEIPKGVAEIGFGAL